jgi:hypothetical protein
MVRSTLSGGEALTTWAKMSGNIIIPLPKIRISQGLWGSANELRERSQSISDFK